MSDGKKYLYPVWYFQLFLVPLLVQTLKFNIMELQKIQTNDLLQMYANADVTCGCGGHWKGSQNERLRKEYATELEKRGIKVPKTLAEKIDKSFVASVEIPKGQFNGNGSY